MGANKNSNLQKCGEILIDINSKNRKNKIYILHCIFCNMEFDQIKKFSLHIGEEHLNNLDQAVIKFEAEPEEIIAQSYTDVKVPDIQVFDSSVNSDVLERVNPVSTVLNHDINCKIKQEFKENSNDESNFYGWEVTDYADSIGESDRGSKGQLDTSFIFDSDIKDDLDEIPQKRKKLNVAKKAQKLKQMLRTFKVSPEDKKDADSNVLNHIFKDDPIYTELRTYHDNCGQLGSSEQNKLTRAIIDFYVLQNIRLGTNYFRYLASQIVKLFPGESKEVYFEKQDNKRAKGKLVYRYQNMLKASVKPYKPKYMDKKVHFVVNEEEALKTKSFLKYNFDDTEETCRRWKQCIEYRLKELSEYGDANIANIINNWPAYRQSFGAELISIDFEALYPGRSNNFFLNWAKLIRILPTVFDMNLKHQKLKSVWIEAKEKWTTLDQNSKDALYILLMHGILKPELISKELGKPTILESQLATIKFIEKDIQLNLYTGHLPFVLIRKSLFAVKNIFVVTDQIIYKMDTVRAALALCFKIHQVFNLKYDRVCINFWLFIQKTLFEIHLKDDYEGNSLRYLSSFFKSQK